MGAEPPQRGTAPPAPPAWTPGPSLTSAPKFWPANPQQSGQDSGMDSFVPTPCPPSPEAQHSPGWVGPHQGPKVGVTPGLAGSAPT